MAKSQQNTYHRQTAAFIAKVAENLPTLTADQMQAWLENPSTLAAFLRGLDQLIVDRKPSDFQEWREITVGGMTVDMLLAELQKAGCSYNERMVRSSFEMHPRLPNFNALHRVSLTLVSPRELGFTTPPVLYAFLKRAEEKGLSHFPIVGPFLRLQFLDQEKGGLGDTGFLMVASDPIDDGSGKSLFYLDREDDKFFLTDSVHDGKDVEAVEWHLNQELVFVRSFIGLYSV